MESGKIPNASVTASSQKSPLEPPEYARLHFNKGAWTMEPIGNNPWLQVAFGTDTQVTGISTQGHPLFQYWVKSYSLRYSNDGLYFEHIKVTIHKHHFVA